MMEFLWVLLIIIKILLTDIMQYNSYSKIILIEGEKIKNGQIYNIYLKEDGLFSASILKKCYRYHRELTDESTLREMITDFYGSSNMLRFQQN